ncbi:MAG TPA: iron ABC transporter substrate-binding protein [Solirubrobacterales bacterium]|nr:iron ABC transporter substrate-binding protein [Solirubrobacterales bacterium]
MPRARTAAILAALLAALLAGCGGDSDQSPADPDAPTGEAGITVYSGRIPPEIGPLIDLYEQRIGRDIEVRFGETAALAAQIVEEGENTPADVFFAQDAGALGAIQDQGRFERLPAATLERVPSRFRSTEGEWVGTSGRARVIAYGEDVNSDELPESVFGLTGEEWRGRVGWAPLNGSFQAFITAMRLTEGDDVARDFVEGMLANDVQPYENNIAIRDAIAAGEIDAGLINHYYVAQAKAEDPDYPVEIYFPPGDLGSMVNVAGAGVIAGSDQPQGAEAFVEFLLSREAQQFFSSSTGEYPLVDGIRADPSLVPLGEIPQPKIDLSEIDDLEGTLELLRSSGAL